MPPERSFIQKIGDVLQNLRSVGSILWQWEARFKGAILGQSVVLIGRPILSIAPDSELHISDGVRLNSAERANPLACFQPCVLRTMAPGARLILGPGVGMSGTVVCAASSIEIGEGTIAGSGAMLIDNDFHEPGPSWTWAEAQPSNARPIRVGRGVFIGARSIVLKGVTIGDRAIIGAGAVVTKDVPSGMMAVGNPAKNIVWKGHQNLPHA